MELGSSSVPVKLPGGFSVSLPISILLVDSPFSLMSLPVGGQGMSMSAVQGFHEAANDALVKLSGLACQAPNWP
ncbi:hypothetical protein D3C77_301310 [compost metagenome]|jgi:hypothetical protein